MISYNERSNLYSLQNYSTNVIQSVGGEPECGWGGPNSKDGDRGLPLHTLYGVELEVSTDYKVKDIIDAFPEIFVIGKSDSSITGTRANPIEIVTIPATLRKQKDMWNCFFEKVDEDKFDTLDRHNNGMHIHVDRRAFQKEVSHLKKFCYFFTNPGNTEFLKAISERDEASFKQYAKFVTSTHALRAERAVASSDKHSIINLTHTATVEVRMFKGVVCQTSVIKNLEFVDSIVEFSNRSSMAKMDLSSYLFWLEHLPKTKYRTLRLCISDMNLSDMIHKSVIKKAVISTNPRVLEHNLQMGILVIPESLEEFFIKEFTEKHKLTGWSVQKVNDNWVMTKLGTRFAKFDNQTSKMFARRKVAA